MLEIPNSSQNSHKWPKIFIKIWIILSIYTNVPVSLLPSRIVGRTPAWQTWRRSASAAGGGCSVNYIPRRTTYRKYYYSNSKKIYNCTVSTKRELIITLQCCAITDHEHCPGAPWNNVTRSIARTRTLCGRCCGGCSPTTRNQETRGDDL